ncbi:hypothetical protein G6F56_003267 [Rhizopus delemar]|nr:hypothetical protein G6F56_003267 [Rhizopus delemar]
MNAQLVHDPSKLNPKFENYKLQPCIEVTTVSRSSLLEAGIQLRNESLNDHNRLGFRDLQARVRQNHLFYGYLLDENRSSSFIVDHEYQLHMLVYDKQTRASEFYYISQLIKPIGSVPSYCDPNEDVPIEPQSCSVVTISHGLILASNGAGDIELIGVEEKNGKIQSSSLGTACYTGVGDEGIQPVPCYLLTARQIQNKVTLIVYSRAASKSTEFNIATLEMEIPTELTKDESLILHTMHIQTGPEVPVYCTITPSGRCILASETRYSQAQTKDEEEMELDEPVKTPVYKWSQEGADITLWFHLPPNTPKSSVNCKFLHDHLSLIVQDTAITFPFRKLWSQIRADECVWTIDSNKQQLTLFLTKADENTRWPQLFDKDDHVSETLSVGQLSEINTSLAKFTSDDDNQFLKAAQHPAATDMDEDIDESGQPVVFGVYNSQGRQVQTFSSEAYRWIGQSFAGQSLGSVCLGLDVDGLVFGLSEQEGLVQIEHCATLDAFSFVQASKRDARYILHDPSLYFTCIIESTRNIYIYFHHDDKRTVESQTLVDLTLGENVDVIGAQLVTKNTLMVLTETQVITIQLD